VPASVDELRDRILHGNAERFGAMANVAELIGAEDHVRREPHLKEIEAQWGPAPGRHQSDGASIHVLGAHFGNVFVGVQPGFGYEGDPMRLLFEKRVCADARFFCLLPLAARRLRRPCGTALRDPRRARVHARQAGRHVGRVLARSPHRRAAEPLPVRRQQPVGRHDRQAPRRGHAGELPDPADRPGRPVSRPDRPQGAIERWRGLAPDAHERVELAVLIQAQAADWTSRPPNPPGATMPPRK
jgi:magnesium chelatase subunit H